MIDFLAGEMEPGFCFELKIYLLIGIILIGVSLLWKD